MLVQVQRQRRTKWSKTPTRSYRFRAEVTESGLHFLDVGELCGSVSVCHQNEPSPADHGSLWMRDIISISSDAAFKDQAAGRLWSHHSHGASFPPVLHQRHHPHLVWTVLPSVPQCNLGQQRNKSSLATPAHFPVSKNNKITSVVWSLLPSLTTITS